MKCWMILLDNKIVDRQSHDEIFDPAIFFDERSAKRAKEIYFPASEYQLVEAEVTFEIFQNTPAR